MYKVGATSARAAPYVSDSETFGPILRLYTPYGFLNPSEACESLAAFQSISLVSGFAKSKTRYFLGGVILKMTSI